MPLLFAYTPFIGGTWAEVFQIFFFALFGLYAFTAALQGFMETRLSPPLRLLVLGAAVALLWPTTLVVHIAGLVVLLAVFAFNWRSGQARPAVPV